MANYDWVIDESAGGLIIMGLNIANQISPHHLGKIFGIIFWGPYHFPFCIALGSSGYFLDGQAHAAAATGLLARTEFHMHMPPAIAVTTRGRLKGLRLQLSLLDREFDDLGLLILSSKSSLIHKGCSSKASSLHSHACNQILT